MKIRLLPSRFGLDIQVQLLTSFLINECVAVDAGSLGFALNSRERENVQHIVPKLIVPQIRYVNVGAQPHVVSQVPAIVVRVLVDRDVVTIPEPVITVVVVVRGDVEVETTKPETFPASAGKPEDMAAAEAAIKASLFPCSIHVVVAIITAGIVSDPRIVGVNVGSFGMSLPVRKPAVFWSGRLVVPGRPLLSGRSRTAVRNVSITNIMTATVTLLVAPALRRSRDSEHQDQR